MDVKTLCLGVLSRRPCSGYEIRKEFEDGAFAPIQDAGFGSIYPALKRLTEEGLADCTEHAQDSRPDKKVYRITGRGRQALFDAVARDPGPDKLRSDFWFTLMFADLLPARQLDRLLANRMEFHRRAIACLEGDCGDASAGEAFVRGFGLAMHRAALDYLEAHQHELLAAGLKPRPAVIENGAPADDVGGDRGSG